MTLSPELNEAVAAFQRGELDDARAIAERAVKSTPSPQWNHLLGLIHCRLGDAARGVDHLRTAARAEPGNAAFQVMLVRALVDAGRPDEVLAMPEPPPIASHAGLALWQSRAEAATMAGDQDAAADAWAKVAAAAPNDWRALVNLGSARAAQLRWDEASVVLAKAAELKSDDPAIRRAAASALIEAGRRYRAEERYEEAEVAFRRAYELDRANRSAIHHLGLVLERTNQLEALSTLLNEAAEAGVESDRLAYLWAVRARREGRVEDARELLLQADPSENPVGWNRLRAQIADQLGDTAEAYAAAEAMNEAAQKAASKGIDLDKYLRQGEAYRQQQHQLARTITRKWAARISVVEEPPQQKIAFLLGFPRSGTTLLDTFLMGHPNVDVLEEKQVLLIAGGDLGPLENLPDASAGALQQARRRYFDELGRHVSPGFGGVVVDKFPLYMGSAPLMHALFPNAPVIFAQRHPCDVVLSAFMQSFGLMNFSDIRAAADYYDAMMRIWTATVEAMPLNVHTLIYEDLVRDPDAALKPAVEFLGLEWDERLLDHRKTARERGTIVTPSYDQVTQPVTTRPSGRWKRYREQLEPVLPILLPWAQRLGYSD